MSKHVLEPPNLAIKWFTIALLPYWLLYFYDPYPRPGEIGPKEVEALRVRMGTYFSIALNLALIMYYRPMGFIVFVFIMYCFKEAYFK